MASILSLIGGVKGIAVILLVAALGGYVWNLNNKLGKAEKQNELVTAQRDLAAQERDKAIEVNKQNEVVVKRLEQEKLDIQIALNNLENTKKKDAIIISDLTRKIKNQSSNPENKVVISPVIRDVIGDIQAERARRRGALQ